MFEVVSLTESQNYFPYRKMTKLTRKLGYFIVAFAVSTLMITGCNLTREEVLELHKGSPFTFTDQNEEKGVVSGKIMLDVSGEAKDKIHQWVVYWSDSATERGKSARVCAAKVTDGSICGISNAKIQGEYLILFASDKKGEEFFTELSTSVKDKVKEEPKAEESAAQIPEPGAEEVETVATEESKERKSDVASVSDTALDPESVIPEEHIGAPKPVVIIKVENILYDFDRAEIKPSYMAYLDETFEGVENKEEMTFVIAGHADERGSNEYNLALGERRAYAVKRYLISLGFLEENVKIISYGEEKPFDTGHNEAAWAKNRRAVTEVTQ